MDAFTTHTGVAAPLPLGNVDTDQILPSRYLKRITRSGFEDALFYAWRQDPGFVLNQAAYVDASVLVVGPDFGTGSSREPAVWALQDFGFRAVVGSRFGDIFRTNAGKAGLVVAAVSESLVEELLKRLSAAPGTQVTVDLEQQQVTCAGWTAGFEMNTYTRWRLLNGLDDVAVTMESEPAITAFEARRRRLAPTVPRRQGAVT